MEYKFRKAVPEDKNSIEKLFIEMLKSIYHTESVAGYDERYLNKFFGNSDNLIYVAEFDN
ncbi:MAG: hypothetical protein IJ305_01415 [Oscillospiraceae bacterium]|nr:hypothetical protein [Oscillospiraceae bacterium]